MGNPAAETKIIHILGARSGVGKSTLCMGLMGWLLQHGFESSKLAYIKPMTQCLDQQLVTDFCAHYEIACQPIGPLIFSSGLTRRYIETPAQDREDYLDTVLSAVKSIGQHRQFVFVDGIGHPAVGTTNWLAKCQTCQSHEQLQSCSGL